MLKKILCMALVAVMCLTLFAGCELFEDFEWPDLSFEGMCKTTEDGFVYYDNTPYGNSEGLCIIIKLPDTEEVVIPEYIEGKRVAQLGYESRGLGYRVDYTVDISHIKKLTIQHDMDWYSVSIAHIKTLIYVDYPYCVKDVDSTIIRISYELDGGGNTR